MEVLPPFVLGLFGTSLTSNGRLSADWPQHLQRDLQQAPEAFGPITVIDWGKGSTASDWAVANAFQLATLRPSHILTEGFSINDAVDAGSGPAVSIADHDANVTNFVGQFRAARADVDITIQTMNPVSAAGAGLRPNLAAYYARDVVLAGTLGLGLIDNYNGQAGGPAGGWPKPLPDDMSQNDPNTGTPDGLHPNAAAIAIYLYPNLITWARAKMAAYWPIPAGR